MCIRDRAGLYDQWRRLRVAPGLKGLIDSQPGARDYEEEVAPVAITGASARKEFEKGRVVYIPGVKFDGRLPEYGSFFRVDERFWKLPKNAQEITDGVRWAARDDVPVRVNGPTYLVSNLVEQPGKRRMMLHLVNYNAKKIGSLEAVEVICRLPGGQAAKEVRKMCIRDRPRPGQPRRRRSPPPRGRRTGARDRRPVESPANPAACPLHRRRRSRDRSARCCRLQSQRCSARIRRAGDAKRHWCARDQPDNPTPGPSGSHPASGLSLIHI